MEVSQNNYKGQGPLDAFLNLFNLITLGWLAISFGQLVFWLINRFFSPEFIDQYGYSQTGLKFAIASLIIVTPIFLLVAGYLHKEYKLDRLSPQSGIHRWLTYLMLLISALNIIGSLIAIVFRLLEGDYTLATILKILTVFLIALGIFGYYWFDLRRKDYSQKNIVSVASAYAVVVLVLAAIISSFFMVDSPVTSRMRNFDRQRVDNLNSLTYMIDSDYNNTKALPASLSGAKYEGIIDPETKQPYEYRVISADSYELCATFSLKATADNRGYIDPGNLSYHQAGHQCFTLRPYSAKLIN